MNRTEFKAWTQDHIRLMDGATGSNLMKAGMPRGVCTESWVLEHPDVFQTLQRLRDEAHRFAITHHRALRSKASVASRLDTVAGVGEQRRKAILKHFKTVEALKAATADEIAQVLGLPESVALNVYAMLHDGEGDSSD